MPEHDPQPRFYFMHIKKCAGTSIVSLAKKQRKHAGIPVSLPDPNVNGLPAKPNFKDEGLKGRKRWVEFWRWPLADQAAFLADQDCTFVANEGEIDESFEKLDGFTYVVCIRDGAKRYISHFRHNQRSCGESGEFDVIQSGRGPQPNYMTFQLANRRVSGFDADALNVAKANLAKFDKVLFVETLSNDIAFLKDHGWRTDMMSHENKKRGLGDVVPEPTEADMALIRDLNATDIALSDWARETYG